MKKVALGPLILRSKLFILGIILGLFFCSFAGRVVAIKGYYKNFVRINGAHANGTAFLVTASQISALIRKNCQPDQILVVIGGSSIMMGTGQPISRLWTRDLQDSLGGRYCVFNLATPGGWLGGYAAVTVNMIGNNFKDFVLVSNSLNPPMDSDGQLFYKHFFWDAYYKGLLKNAPVDYSEERVDKISAVNLAADYKTKTRFEQVKIGMFLDSLFYFNDLWTFVHYAYGQTIYAPNSGSYNWKPQGSIPDYDWEVDEQVIRKLEHYPGLSTSQFDFVLGMVKDFTSRYFVSSPKGNILKENLIQENKLAIKNYPLTDIASKVIIVQDAHSPYYISRMTLEEQKNYLELLRQFDGSWRANGYRTVTMDGMEAADYADMMHPNTLGGSKYSKKVTKVIKAMTSH